MLEARTFCRANGGLLYLRTEGEMLKPVIARYEGADAASSSGPAADRPTIPLVKAEGDGAGHSVAAQVTLSGQSLNIDLKDSPQNVEYDLQLETAEAGGAAPASVLAIPLKNSAGSVLGVLELLDAKDAESGQPVPFDQNLQQMMESYSSLAAAALEAYIREQSLRQVIQQLRIEIDEVKRQQQVSEIVDTDFFQDLQERARAMRARKRS